MGMDIKRQSTIPGVGETGGWFSSTNPQEWLSETMTADNAMIPPVRKVVKWDTDSSKSVIEPVFLQRLAGGRDSSIQNIISSCYRSGFHSMRKYSLEPDVV